MKCPQCGEKKLLKSHMRRHLANHQDLQMSEIDTVLRSMAINSAVFVATDPYSDQRSGSSCDSGSSSYDSGSSSSDSGSSGGGDCGGF